MDFLCITGLFQTGFVWAEQTAAVVQIACSKKAYNDSVRASMWFKIIL